MRQYGANSQRKFYEFILKFLLKSAKLFGTAFDNMLRQIGASMFSLAILAYLVIFIAVFSLLLKLAPVGYEDEEGFHYSKKDRTNFDEKITVSEFPKVRDAA